MLLFMFLIISFYDSSYTLYIINNTMLIQIAVLAWVFLGEALDGKAILGLILAGTGTLIVQVARTRPPAPAAPQAAGD